MNDRIKERQQHAQRALVTGGTGFIGQHLVRKLDHPIVAGRNQKHIVRVLGKVTACQWRTDQILDPAAIEGVDSVFHLAGESVFNGRWNAEKKKRILDSRVQGTRNLVQSLIALDRKPSVLVCASAIGYYGSRGEEILTENSLPGEGFMAEVCRAWEREAIRAAEFGIRTVMVRTGIVLGPDGGALTQMILPFKLGLGGWLGNGRQYMSWIHIDDLVGIMLHAAATPTVRGPGNGVAPHPVTNREFTATLASVLRRPAVLPVPGFLLKGMLGEFGQVMLGSQRVMPEKMIRSGYSFLYPELQPALRNILL